MLESQPPSVTRTAQSLSLEGGNDFAARGAHISFHGKPLVSHVTLAKQKLLSKFCKSHGREVRSQASSHMGWPESNLDHGQTLPHYAVSELLIIMPVGTLLTNVAPLPYFSDGKLGPRERQTWWRSCCQLSLSSAVPFRVEFHGEKDSPHPLGPGKVVHFSPGPSVGSSAT